MFNLLFKRKNQLSKSDKWVFGTMLVSGAIGLLASFVLTLEKFHLMEQPDAVLSCSFNLVLNCSTVMQTWQSSVFGFPNMLIGLMAYAVVVTVAVAGLSGVKLPRLFLIATNIGYLLGVVFAYWLFFQSVYVIEILCPWCLVVTFVTTLIFATITDYNLRNNVFQFNKKLDKKIQVFIAKDLHKFIVASWVVLMVILVFVKFGESLFA